MPDLSSQGHLSKFAQIMDCMFVCGTARAVHLDFGFVTSLPTDNFLLAFRRFVARRSQPFQTKQFLRSGDCQTNSTLFNETTLKLN